jgi:hypothetical protein
MCVGEAVGEMVIRPQLFMLKHSSYFHIYAVMRLFLTPRKCCFRVVHIPDIMLFSKAWKTQNKLERVRKYVYKKNIHIWVFYVQV